MRIEIMLILVILSFGVVMNQSTNSTLSECPENYYGDKESSPQDLLDRWCDGFNGSERERERNCDTSGAKPYFCPPLPQD
jgi:hypothetical protein